MGGKIKENWAAIEKAEELARAKTGDPEAGFNAGTFFFGKEGRSLMIPILYRGKKGKKGQESFTDKRNEMMIHATFCPFTGKPLWEDSIEKSTPKEV